MHLESISNGFGSQSMALLVLRKRKIVRGDISMSADTGSEFDCLWSNGRRTDARTFFEEVIAPYCRDIGIKAVFVRTRDKKGNAYPPLHEAMLAMVNDSPRFVPLFGSEGGRLMQQCTDRWKVRAMLQEARRRGAGTMRAAIGLHCEEMGRVKGRWVGKSKLDGFNTFRCTERDWLTKHYPLIDLKMTRQDCRELCDEEGLLYIVGSQCNMCPHKNRERWERDLPSTLAWAAEIESRFGGNFFLTDKRIPLMQALPLMTPPKDDDFGCENDVCGF